jgi:hypothetical protein
MPKRERSIRKTYRKTRFLSTKNDTESLKFLKSESHEEKYTLQNIVSKLCQDEKKILPHYLEKNGDLKKKQSQEIQDALMAFLQELPLSLSDQDVYNFEPELSRFEKQNIIEKTSQLKAMNSKLECLVSLENSLENLRHFSGLWLGRIPSRNSSQLKSDHVIHIAGEFKSVLESMDRECDRIIQFAIQCDGDIKQVKILQEKLYEIFNLVSFLIAVAFDISMQIIFDFSF